MGFDATQVLNKQHAMKQWKQWVIIVAMFLIAGLADNCSDDPRAHSCPDETHATCDSRCECDGHECPAE